MTRTSSRARQLLSRVNLRCRKKEEEMIEGSRLHEVILKESHFMEPTA